MNDLEFDAFLRETLRMPAPAHVPLDVRADEIERVVAAVFDELVWGDDTGLDDEGLDDDRQEDDPQRAGLHSWDDAGAPDAWETDDENPLPSSDTLHSDDRHHPDDGTFDSFEVGHGDIGHGDTGHGDVGHHHGPPDHGLDES